jgi:hypothetical protein
VARGIYVTGASNNYRVKYRVYVTVNSPTQAPAGANDFRTELRAEVLNYSTENWLKVLYVQSNNTWNVYGSLGNETDGGSTPVDTNVGSSGTTSYDFWIDVPEDAVFGIQVRTDGTLTSGTIGTFDKDNQAVNHDGYNEDRDLGTSTYDTDAGVKIEFDFQSVAGI